ncbi:MAG: adenylate/guanylate cyclase domain-containing protein [Trichlorobacter sp.]|nr:adenylate/guanylate cyclase domain-containing protein [Trichlorobacter sp.]
MKKRLPFILFGLLGILVAFTAYQQAFPALQQLDYRMKDTRFRIRGAMPADPAVVVIAIDHASIKELGRWPWSREITGKLIENLAFYGARVTALDIVFSETQDVATDRALAASITNAKNVVLGYFFRDEEQPLDPLAALQLERSAIRLMRVADGVESLPLVEYSNIDTNLPILGENALDAGFFNARPDGDGLYRRTILLLLHDGSIYPSLGLSALRHYLGSDIMLEVQPWGVNGVWVGQKAIPAREDGTLALNYYGSSGAFRTVSAADVIAKRLQPDALKDALVFVGATEIGIYDIRPTPFDTVQPGVELHATLAANALQNRFLLYDGDTQLLEIICIIVFPLLLGLLLAFVPGTFGGLLAVGVLLGSFSLVNYQAFATWFKDMTVIYPLLGMGITYLGSEAWRNLVVEKKGRQLKKAFSNYVSPDLVREIEKNPDKLVLGGEQRELSILFSDIRGFTTVSESLTPPELVKLLNEYLSPMTKIVLEEKGTLDKFIGDAVMALFNAPLDLPDHATRACTAAVRMLAELKKLNESFAARGMHTIDIGIGINTGDAVVGNMGADIRFDYTAIGDAVNLASRLEGQNKMYGSHILVSESTRSQVPDGMFCFREVDRIKVKGKLQPVIMFELMTENTGLLPRFEEALAQYRAASFAAACQIFEELADNFNDSPSRLYVERCKNYMQTPPPADWDGVYTAESK